MPETWSGTAGGLNTPAKQPTDGATGMRVPSVVVELEDNFVLNVAHADFAQISITRTVPFAFDPPLLS